MAGGGFGISIFAGLVSVTALLMQPSNGPTEQTIRMKRNARRAPQGNDGYCKGHLKN